MSLVGMNVVWEAIASRKPLGFLVRAGRQNEYLKKITELQVFVYDLILEMVSC